MFIINQKWILSGSPCSFSFFQVDSDIELDPRPEYHRVVLTWFQDSPIPVAKSTGNQISSRLLSVNTANALLLLPPKSSEKPEVKKDETVDAMIIARL